ncbi:uncharacterized protein LOC129583011 [Paramacrobiotus metropolitanus]|uniref:uncharacterized protein LOC129583011 n=1 Tax=Paramacrobiotus metropolitanus TaxID=2943436 RepID=UPI002445851E|nr:uncharacterized protein LOC129583011 [Paramacrobiotus metropolitanus]
MYYTIAITLLIWIPVITRTISAPSSEPTKNAWLTREPDAVGATHHRQVRQHTFLSFGRPFRCLLKDGKMHVNTPSRGLTYEFNATTWPNYRDNCGPDGYHPWIAL